MTAVHLLRQYTPTILPSSRIIDRYSAQGEQSCELQVAYSVVVLHPVPKLVRPMILKGADSGLKKNFATVVELLQRRCVVKSMQPAGERGWVEQAAVATAEAGTSGWALTIGLTGELLTAMRPWARAAVALPGVGSLVGVDTLCALLSSAALLAATIGSLAAFAFVQRVCWSLPGWWPRCTVGNCARDCWEQRPHMVNITHGQHQQAYV